MLSSNVKNLHITGALWGKSTSSLGVFLFLEIKQLASINMMVAHVLGSNRHQSISNNHAECILTLVLLETYHTYPITAMKQMLLERIWEVRNLFFILEVTPITNEK